MAMAPHQQAIHFAASHLHWLTRAQASHGWFQLDALLECTPAGADEAVPYVLAAHVPAGRMYAPAGPLLQQPPYSFQLIAGPSDHTILRRAVEPSGPAVPADSSHEHQHQFQSLDWQLSIGPAEPLQPEGLALLRSPPPSLNLLLELANGHGHLRLQAPLRHWNHRADPTGWQLETGPLLWPMNLQTFLAAPSSAGLTTAWMHANRSNRVTMSGDRLPAHELEAQLSLLAFL
ncbi:hypothetical protein KBY70_05910 [Cyanobium sp. ATX 6E8]|nr:hypothetical protein [Cyanobium sp. ATX 6E8]